MLPIPAMVNRLVHLFGLLGVLLALIVQLETGASLPRIDPIVTAGTLCHTADDADGAPSPGTPHPTDCPVCPLCATVHAQGIALVSNVPALPQPDLPAMRRAELPPPSTAPPSPHRRPAQPRAPPIFS